jgi:hypothetical protein
MFRKLLSSITIVLLIGIALTGVARGGNVKTPMEEDLDADGYNIFDVNDLDVDGDVSVGWDLDVTGKIIAEIFQSTDCTATGTKAVAFGYGTDANGIYSTAMGLYSKASGYYSTAMGNRATASGTSSTAMGGWTIASGACSTAMGGGPLPPSTIASGACSTAIGTIVEATGDYSAAIGAVVTAGPADYTTAMGLYSTNNVANSFTVGYGTPGTDAVDFRVQSGQVNVYGDLEVDDNVGIATTSPTAKLDVNSNIIRLRTSKTPASASAAGNAGDICWDSNYVYICVATNTWKRAALSSW